MKRLSFFLNCFLPKPLTAPEPGGRPASYFLSFILHPCENPRTAIFGIILAFLPGPSFCAEKAAGLYWFVPDGMRADIGGKDIFELAAEGKLPNIRKMMETGSYGYSMPVYPSHTPVNFATLMTGCYPERHGVSDGQMRLEGYGLAKPSISGFSSTAKKVPPAWKLFEDAGKSVVVVSVPGSTPPRQVGFLGLRFLGR
jgi:hypothetical protein